MKSTRRWHTDGVECTHHDDTGMVAPCRRWHTMKRPMYNPSGDFFPEGTTWETPQGVTANGPVRPYDPPPSHYDGANGVQPWDVIDAFGLDYYLGNVLKYVCRAGKKNSRLDDLKKARNFINRAIEQEEKKA